MGGTETSNGNGHFPDGLEAIIGNNQARADERRRFLEDSEKEIARREGEVEHLKNQRHIARMLLSEKAGLFGYTYDPNTDELTRTTIKDPKILETPPPSPESVKEPFDPSRYEIPPTAPTVPKERQLGTERALKWFDALMWLAVLPLGSFLGYSIGLMAGFPVKNDPNYAVAAAVFGVFLLATMKAAVFKLAHLGTRRAQTTGSPVAMILSFVAGAVFMGAEMFLAANALVRYTSERAQFTDQPAMPLGVAAGVALCFSTPILLSSLVKGWYEGTGHEDERTRQRVAREAALADAKRYHSDLAAAKQRHEEALHQRYAKALVEHQASIDRFEKTNEELAKNADWQAVQQFRSAIRNLTERIKEHEKELTGYSIRRGMRLSTETERGASLPASVSASSTDIVPMDGTFR